MMLEAVSSLPWETLPCACLPWVCKLCPSVESTTILMLPIPLNLAFLIACSSWDSVVLLLPALNEVGCCLSVSKSLVKQAVNQVTPRCGAPAAVQPRLAGGHSLSQGPV